VGGTYTATSLTVGSGNTYRLGAGGGTASTSALKISGVNNVLTGNAALVVGSTLSTAPYVEGNGWVTLSNANNYTGGTTINAASTLDAQLLTAGATALGSTTAAVNLNAGALQLITNVAATSTTIGALNFNGGSELAFNTAPTATTTA
jgi:autotransporter-associated beta strand protein